MAPSTPEEIAAQHAEAVRLVEEGLQCAPRQELGEIPGPDKQTPTTELLQPPPTEGEEKKSSAPEDLLLNPVCFTTRGSMDVTSIQKLVQEGYNLNYRKDNPERPPLSPTNYWDPRNAFKQNVTITRPSHDAWGIQKIVLLFCDDFATKIFQLPWWKDFEPSIKPILDMVLPVDGTLIRALFASLPPGVTIPVHHDTGEWVKRTHRVHVPILVNDPSKVLFRCGPTVETMQRIDCLPGHMFEINNQAKHAVSNCDSDHRVHLIVDYIHGPGPKRTLLEAGEKIVQSRRSIDRLKDMDSRPTPSYIILGAQKAGTTSLYDYINQHPWVIKARRRETHCLDWRWNDKLKTTKKQLEFCQKFFYTEELRLRPSCLTGDSTPSYLLDSRRVIPRLKAVFNWKMRLFVMVRDPVKRALSHYAMVTSSEGTEAQLKTRGSEWRGKTFRQVIDDELVKMQECGLVPYWDTKEGVTDMELFNKFSGSPLETKAWDLYLQKHVPLNTGSYGLLTRGLYVLQIRPWLEAFDADHLLVLKLESMKQKGVQSTMSQVWEHLDLPNHPVDDETPKNTREYQPMDPDTQKYLQAFFDPHNKQLASVLQSDSLEWNNPWPYE
ncbi:unnamed protein product [Cylindrotheca closterium]|uniref:Aspartyl/asparaginy/proline hydroxylase domain-containing protein n=1 Tax=Cylindrotheca closterium TaxID=2856 RepID=A0AAD2FTG0_9STRA|nr:unnamed protein product [Cylindrotheca closterium]